MRVKMISLSARPSGVRRPGDIVEVDAAEGRALIARGHAVEVEARERRTAEAPTTARTASTKPAGNRGNRGGKGRQD